MQTPPPPPNKERVVVYMYVADVTVGDEAFPVSGMLEATNHRDAKEKAKKEVEWNNPNASDVNVREVTVWK